MAAHLAPSCLDLLVQGGFAVCLFSLWCRLTDRYSLQPSLWPGRVSLLRICSLFGGDKHVEFLSRRMTFALCLRSLAQACMAVLHNLALWPGKWILLCVRSLYGADRRCGFLICGSLIQQSGVCSLPWLYGQGGQIVASLAVWIELRGGCRYRCLAGTGRSLSYW